MHDVLESGKQLACCITCVALAVAGGVTVLAIVLNLVKRVLL